MFLLQNIMVLRTEFGQKLRKNLAKWGSIQPPLFH